jgi:molybdopterin-guanine dinucleotide biosynthesis protein A
MGRPKAVLQFGAATLIERILAELARAFEEIVVVAAPEAADDSALAALGGVTLLRDERPFAGPVGALARGLEAIRADAAFACACDLPLLDAHLAQALLAMLPGYDAVIPEVGGITQPLHAAYRKGCARSLRDMDARGETRLYALADSARVRRVGEDELFAIDPGLHSFLNVNTPADYARALRLAGLA